MKEYCLLAGVFVCLLKSKDTTRLLSVLVGEVASFFSSQFRSLLYLQGDINRTCPHPGRPRGTGRWARGNGVGSRPLRCRSLCPLWGGEGAAFRDRLLRASPLVGRGSFVSAEGQSSSWRTRSAGLRLAAPVDSARARAAACPQVLRCR